MFAGRFLEIMKAWKEARKKFGCLKSVLLIEEEYVLKPEEREKLEAIISSIRASEE